MVACHETARCSVDECFEECAFVVTCTYIACMYVCIHVCMYACMYVCMYVYMYACAGFLSGNASRGANLAMKNMWGGKSKALQITVYPEILAKIKFGGCTARTKHSK